MVFFISFWLPLILFTIGAILLFAGIVRAYKRACDYTAKTGEPYCPFKVAVKDPAVWMLLGGPAVMLIGALFL